jgi:hypothetical protein
VAHFGGQQSAAAQDHKEHQGDDGVEDKAGQEQRGGAEGQVGFGEDAVDRDAVDGDGRETAGLGAVDHHHAHQQRADFVLPGEAERDGGNDGDGRGRQCAHGRDDCGDGEHHPGDERDAASHEPDGAADQEVDGAVVLGDGEQVSDADDGQEETAGEVGQDVVGGHAQHHGAEQERTNEGEGTHVQGQDGGKQEHRRQDDDGQDRSGHRWSSVGERKCDVSYWLTGLAS